jgi:predicted signal transduction protein with EAL and GGDEF domain
MGVPTTMNQRRLEFIGSIVWVALAFVVAIYCAVMLNRSAATFKNYEKVVAANHALMLKNQAVGLSNQALVVEHIKHDQEVLRQLKELSERVKPRP